MPRSQHLGGLAGAGSRDFEVAKFCLKKTGRRLTDLHCAARHESWTGRVQDQTKPPQSKSVPNGLVKAGTMRETVV